VGDKVVSLTTELQPCYDSHSSLGHCAATNALHLAEADERMVRVMDFLFSLDGLRKFNLNLKST
jgi:hypothetical protein